MVERLLNAWLKPTIKEVYQEGYRDGERRILKAFRYGWNVGHADTMAMLGEIDIEELSPEQEELINLLRAEEM